METHLKYWKKPHLLLAVSQDNKKDFFQVSQQVSSCQKRSHPLLQTVQRRNLRAVQHIKLQLTSSNQRKWIHNLNNKSHSLTHHFTRSIRQQEIMKRVWQKDSYKKCLEEKANTKKKVAKADLLRINLIDKHHLHISSKETKL